MAFWMSGKAMRWVGWVRVYFCPAKWFSVAQGTTQAECRRDMNRYVKEAYKSSRGISQLVLPEGIEPRGPCEEDKRPGPTTA
jgi:hypothetical protein